MTMQQQLQPIGKVLEFPKRAAAPTPAFTSKEDYYDPKVCRTCKCELAVGVHGYLSGGWDSQHWKTIVINCPTCTIDAERQVTEIKQAAMIAKLFNGAHLPFGTRHWRFDTYPQDADMNALSTVRHFLKRWRECDEDGKRGLFLGGETGRCKTSLAISALKEVMEAGYIGLFVSVPDLLKKIQATYNKQSEVTESDLLEAVYTVPWLVLDDLGVEKPTEFAVKEFYLIIEKRRMSGLWTIITSNLTTKNLEDYWRPDTVKPGGFHAGVRVAERIREYCLGVGVQGRNQRGLAGR